MGTYGIDLGTTYSCIAKLNEFGEPKILKNYIDGTDMLASAVFFQEDGNVLIGEMAKEYIETSPERLVQFVKREIGRPNGKTYTIDDKEYNATEISALILKKLKKIAEEQGENVKDVIITCPAYFGFEERDATKKAGELAGMNVISLINEPTAAALNYCCREFQDDQNVVVYDLGGGTFDVTVLNMKVEYKDDKPIRKMKVLGTSGNDHLGGKDWDDILFNILIEKFCNEIDVSKEELDIDTIQSIRSKVERTKIVLSSTESVKVRLKSDAGVIEYNVTRQEFEDATSYLVQQTIEFLQAAIKEAGNVKVDHVLLVGGSTNMPMIKNAVNSLYNGIVRVEEPETAVAKGAAIYASVVVQDFALNGEEEQADADTDVEAGENEEEKGNAAEGLAETSESDGTAKEEAVTETADGAPKDDTAKPAEAKKPVTKTEKKPARRISIIDTAPRSFGPGIYSENAFVVDNLVKKGSLLPAKVTKVYKTREKGQENVELYIFENVSYDSHVVPCLNENGEPQETKPEYMMKFLGKLVLPLKPDTPADSPIEVTFEVDISGLNITAKDLSTNEEKTITIKYASGMSEEETAKSIEKINAHTLAD